MSVDLSVATPVDSATSPGEIFQISDVALPQQYTAVDENGMEMIPCIGCGTSIGPCLYCRG
ncbi:hypothetical protein ABGB14_18795 [Nonomuraea sp. B10E15]|uniref:hypothetical protein n=1 Tax=unclassified Nonomuraea TaxID=2593643 RepID=UPI00325D28BB